MGQNSLLLKDTPAGQMLTDIGLILIWSVYWTVSLKDGFLEWESKKKENEKLQ